MIWLVVVAAAVSVLAAAYRIRLIWLGRQFRRAEQWQFRQVERELADLPPEPEPEYVQRAVELGEKSKVAAVGWWVTRHEMRAWGRLRHVWGGK